MDAHTLYVAKVIIMIIIGFVSVASGCLPILLNRLFSFRKNLRNRHRRHQNYDSCGNRYDHPHHYKKKRKQQRLKKQQYQTKIFTNSITFLLCFGGGILFFTSFVHLHPEIREIFNDLEYRNVFTNHITNFNIKISEILICFGFFLVYLLEEIIHYAIIENPKDQFLLQRTMSLKRCQNYHRRIKLKNLLKNQSTHKSDLSLLSFRNIDYYNNKDESCLLTIDNIANKKFNLLKGNEKFKRNDSEYRERVYQQPHQQQQQQQQQLLNIKIDDTITIEKNPQYSNNISKNVKEINSKIKEDAPIMIASNLSLFEPTTIGELHQQYVDYQSTPPCSSTSLINLQPGNNNVKINDKIELAETSISSPSIIDKSIIDNSVSRKKIHDDDDDDDDDYDDDDDNNYLHHVADSDDDNYDGDGEITNLSSSSISFKNAQNKDDLRSLMRGLVTVFALSVHAFFEGLVLGLEDNFSCVWYLFLAIATHKFIIIFCVGVELVTINLKTIFIFFYIVAFSIVTPIGICIGALICNKELLLMIMMTTTTNKTATTIIPEEELANKIDNTDTLLIIAAFLRAISAGTLLYVIFFEILIRDRDINRGRGFLQVSAIILGFCFMMGMHGLVTGEHDHGEGDDDHGHGHSHSAGKAAHNGHPDSFSEDQLKILRQLAREHFSQEG